MVGKLHHHSQRHHPPEAHSGIPDRDRPRPDRRHARPRAYSPLAPSPPRRGCLAYVLARGVDVLIHDGQYTDDEYRQRVGWGHSSIAHAVQLADLAGVRELVLIHHDPDHSDSLIDDLVAAAGASRREGSVRGASERMVLQAGGDAAANARADGAVESSIPVVPPAKGFPLAQRGAYGSRLCPGAHIRQSLAPSLSVLTPQRVNGCE